MHYFEKDKQGFSFNIRLSEENNIISLSIPNYSTELRSEKSDFPTDVMDSLKKYG